MKSGAKSPWLMLSAGLGLGLLVGVGMLVGAVVALQQQPAANVRLPETLLHATATHGGDNFAIATSPIGDDMEGLFTLDFLTGELRCYVLNSRTGVWGAAYRQNIVGDLQVQQGKAPKFLMVTGLGEIIGGGAFNRNQQGGSFVYIMDANTGNFVVYGVPFNRNAAQQGAVQVFPLTRIAVGSAREAVANP